MSKTRKDAADRFGFGYVIDELQAADHIRRWQEIYRNIDSDTHTKYAIDFGTKIHEATIGKFECDHAFTPYVGLREAYHFCTKCDLKKFEK